MAPRQTKLSKRINTSEQSTCYNLRHRESKSEARIIFMAPDFIRAARDGEAEESQ